MFFQRFVKKYIKSVQQNVVMSIKIWRWIFSSSRHRKTRGVNHIKLLFCVADQDHRHLISRFPWLRHISYFVRNWTNLSSPFYVLWVKPGAYPGKVLSAKMPAIATVLYLDSLGITSSKRNNPIWWLCCPQLVVTDFFCMTLPQCKWGYGL